MTKRWILSAGLLAAAAVAYANASNAAARGSTVEHYYTNETWHSFADIGSKDNGGPADVYVAQQSMTSSDGKKMGVANGYGINLHRPFVFFHWTATMTNGSTLTLEGAVSLRETTTVYPIEGGTGRYEGARGTVTLSDAGKKGTLVTIRYRV